MQLQGNVTDKVLYLSQRYHPSTVNQTHTLPSGSAQRAWHHSHRKMVDSRIN